MLHPKKIAFASLSQCLTCQIRINGGGGLLAHPPWDQPCHQVVPPEGLQILLLGRIGGSAHAAPWGLERTGSRRFFSGGDFCRDSHGDIILPIGSMYAIYGNIYHQYTPNVSIYTSTMDPMGYNRFKVKFGTSKFRMSFC